MRPLVVGPADDRRRLAFDGPVDRAARALTAGDDSNRDPLYALHMTGKH